MATDRYMDGTGIKERTRQLTDKLWGTLPFGILGAWVIFLGPFLSWAFLIDRLPWETPPTEFDWGLAIAISAVSIVVGLKMYLPHHRARTTLNKHTKNMERETTRRGEHWARS